jgi:hypothetical protein
MKDYASNMQIGKLFLVLFKVFTSSERKREFEVYSM